MKALLLVFALVATTFCRAQTLRGTVTGDGGVALPFATIEVLGRNLSTTANAEGRYSLSLPIGSYNIGCQHIGYQRRVQKVEVGEGVNNVNFQLTLQQLTLSEVVVKKGEDPAYEIIRNAIKKRPVLKAELDAFTVEVYTKGQMRLRDFPKKFMGQKIDFEDGDTSKNKVLFLSETISDYAFQAPGKTRVEVKASKVSGQSDGFGLSAPQIVSFYESNVSIGSNINPRGFVSPIADNALTFYRYKYEGAFFEDGRQVSRIRVIPKRKFEPVFSGYINIVEDEWRIHSLQLELLKSSGMEMIDTLKLDQLYIPAGGGKWVLKNQVIYPAIRMFGFDAYGSFLNVYANYNLAPQFEPGYFGPTLIKFRDSSNKKSFDYWEQNRPIVLQSDEARDYQKKDSLEALRRSPAYLDSLDRVRNKVTLSNVLLTGVSISRQKRRAFYSVPGLMQLASYNTVEGAVLNLTGTYFKRLDTVQSSRRTFYVSPQLRYGFSNRHLNGSLSATYIFGKAFRSSLSLAGGSDVFQFNNAAPVGVFGSTFGTLFFGANNLKIYEARFARADFWKSLRGGFALHLGARFQARRPLENTTDFSFGKEEANEFTPNRPLPQFNRNIDAHEAFIATVGGSWQPGTRYIEYPEQTISLGSGAPRFSLHYTAALRGVGGSDVSYSKWTGNVRDEINLKLFGVFKYHLDVGGFLNRDSVAIPDYFHYQGNMSSRLSGSYMDRFQLVPHYYFSHTASLFSLLYAEHHFNGLLTNKVPGLKQLKWNLVAGVNGLSTASGQRYLEPFVGLENIFKIIRVDYIWGFEHGARARGGFRIGVKTPFNNLN